jgi:phosphoenolpyruvate phosphomutase
MAEEADLERVSERADTLHGEPSGRWIGILRARGRGREQLLVALETLRSRRDFAQLGMPDLLNALIGAGHTIKVLYIHGHWINVNAAEDLIRGSDFAHGPMSPGGTR